MRNNRGAIKVVAATFGDDGVHVWLMESGVRRTGSCIHRASKR